MKKEKMCKGVSIEAPWNHNRRECLAAIFTQFFWGFRVNIFNVLNPLVNDFCHLNSVEKPNLTVVSLQIKCLNFEDVLKIKEKASHSSSNQLDDFKFKCKRVEVFRIHSDLIQII